MGRHNNSHGTHGRKDNAVAKEDGKWEHLHHGILSLKSNPHTHIKLVGGHRGKYQSFGSEAKAYMERQAQEQPVLVAPAPTETATA
jgi:hypothetical protein